MRYRVRGVHRESGKVIDQVVQASSDASVRAKAEAKGVTIVAIDLVEEPSAMVETRRVEPLAPPQPQVPLQAGHAHGAPVINIVPPKRSSSLGLASVILGVLAFLICWIPAVGCISLPLSGLGLLLAIIGFIVALARGGSSIGFPIAGGAVSALALAIGVVNFAAFRSAMKSLAGPPTLAQQAAGTGEAKQVPTYGLDQPIGNGDLTLTVSKPTIKQLRVERGGGREPLAMDERRLHVTLKIENRSKTKRHAYGSVADDDETGMLDNFSNEYRAYDTNAMYRVLGGVLYEDLYPGKSVTDVLAFEQPVNGVEWLIVRLPGSVVGQRDPIMVRFTMDAVGQQN
jgi:hypothetical protein